MHTSRYLFATFTGIAICALSPSSPAQAKAQPASPETPPSAPQTPSSATPSPAAPQTPSSTTTAPAAAEVSSEAAPKASPPAQAPLDPAIKRLRPTPEPKTRMGTGWGIGVAAGTTSGIGISTRRFFDHGVGLHAGGLYVHLKDWQWGNVGVQGMYTLARGRKTRLYGLLGAQLSFTISHDGSVGGLKQSSDRQSTLFIGPGLGLEMHFTKHFGWAIELPVHAIIALEKGYERLPLGGSVNFFPGANTAFTFYFK